MRPGGPGKRARNNRGHMRRGGGGGGSSGGGGNRNQSFDSTGPDVKVRGTAQQVADKYIALARDASSGGDLVAAENYLQHAEHYQRIVNVYAERAAEQQRERERGERSDDDGGEAQTESRRNRASGGGNGRSRDADNDDDERPSASEDDEQDQPAA